MSWYVEGKTFETELKEGKYEVLTKHGIENVIDIINNKDKEIEKLNNNWNKLEEWLNIEQNISSPEQIINDIFDKIKELKGNTNEKD